jgi:diguanylate cyclase (GGDEF)-like protein
VVALRRTPTRLRSVLREILADPEFDAAHVARIYRVYRVAMPLYAVMTLATAGIRFGTDSVIAVAWILQTCTALGTFLGMLLRPKRADHVMRIGFCLLFVGMLLRVPRAVIAYGLRDLDLHAISVGLVLTLLVAQTLFAPKAARRASLVCASFVFAIIAASFLWIDQPTLDHALSALRLMASTAVLVALVGFVNDTARQYGRLWEEHRLMQTLALCDPLTELPNRRACEATLRREMARGEREHQALSVILLDVDHFKTINDRFGHEAGDRVLLRIAQLLRDNLRASDAPARWAGDEFVAVLPSTSLEQAQLVAERIRRAVAESELGSGRHRTTVTLGVTQLLVGGDDIASLLARADRNLYQAKHNGRNCSVAA